MDDRIQFLPLHLVVEDDSTDFLSVEGAIWEQHFRAEVCDDLSESFCSGLDYLPCEDVRVDDGYLSGLEEAGHG